ncbi:MAG: hypothetical protein ACLFQ8_01300 [Candidatus Aenigmatarchaeota archaeon]
MKRKGFSSTILFLIGALIILAIATALILTAEGSLGNISDLLIHRIRGI